MSASKTNLPSRESSVVVKFFKNITLSGFLKHVGLVSGICLAWACSLFLVSLSLPLPWGEEPKVNDLTALLFGASSIALFLLTSIFGFLALIGWQSIKERLARVDELEKDVKERVTTLETQMKANLHTILGYALGEMSITPDWMITNRDQLLAAVQQCEVAYKLLQDFRGKSFEYMALNNLVFYLSFLEDSSRRIFILEEARRLMAAAQGINYVNFILTACRAILQFSSDEAEKDDMRKILSGIIANNPAATPRDKREAEICLRHFITSRDEPKIILAH